MPLMRTVMNAKKTVERIRVHSLKMKLEIYL